MNQLEKTIIKKIMKEGPITFETFMDMALYYPELGYYSSSDIEIGRGGDFYTGPHLHRIYGAMIARQLIEMWEALGKPGVFHLLEMGAGTGYLCRDIFDYLHRSDYVDSAFLRSLRYVVVEPYKHFRKKQIEVLGDLLNNPPSPSFSKTDNITWVKSLNDIGSITGCILSNELLDAFPVHLVKFDRGFKELYVGFDGTNFMEKTGNISTDEMDEYISDFSIPQSDGYRTEINLRIKSWIRQITDVLAKGFVLTIDYGYTAREFYDESRNRGTLLCYNNHQYNEDPLRNVGKQDISSHLNFSSLKNWGENHELKIVGYCPQGTFLTASGIDRVILELYEDSPDYDDEISKIKNLIMPQGMGESHSVMVQFKGEVAPELNGFSMRNNAGSL